MREIRIALIGVIFGGLFAVAGSVSAQTLPEALASAYNNNPELLAARAKLRSVDEGVPQALAGWRPKVEMSGDIARSNTYLNTRPGDRGQIRTPRNTSLDVTQPLFRGLRTVAGVERAESLVRAQRASLKGTEQDVLLSGVSAYMSVVRDQAVLSLSINNEQVLRRQLEATRDRFEVGEITRTDVAQAEARLAGATADRIKAEGDLKQSRASYLNIVGVAPGTLKQPPEPSDLPKDLQTATDAAKIGHPDVVSAEFSERAARQNIKSVRGELLPTLNLLGSVGQRWESSGNDSQMFAGSVKLDLTVPIYQKGSVYSRLRAAKQDAGKSRLDLADARRDQVNAATSSWEQLQAARARIKSFKAQIRASEIALEGVQTEAQVGSRTVLDVLDAEQELLDAKVNLVRARRDDIVAAYGLKEAI
ncbi:MAG: TolC family outer membrane protein, partial [Proteobacteria bacterium]|nr:TolC family outer membrane protein [Pseudomonadota bacterium]